MKYNCYKHAKLSNKRHDFNIATVYPTKSYFITIEMITV
jgi:hypothetical protein